MCGIVGSIGFKNTKDFIIDGLKDLDYRGYDSAGLAFSFGNRIDIYKAVGSVSNLEAVIPELSSNPYMGVGHTRWATHGKPTEINCHPHQSMHGLFTIVCNGVVENYLQLKQQLQSKGFKFISDTDTEVISNLLEDRYFETRNIMRSIEETMAMLTGSFAVVFIAEMDPKHLYFMKRHSPLMIGRDDNFSLVASDASPMVRYTDKYIDLEDDSYGFISNDDVEIFKKGEKIPFRFTKKSPDVTVKDLNGYPHYMLKEIEEIERVVRRLMVEYYDKGEFLFDHELMKNLTESDHIVFVACGTSYHASLVGARYFDILGKSTSTYIASEFAYYPHFPGRKPFFIFLSQSGETADVIHCMNTIKEHNIPCLVLTNKKGSTLERGCDFSLLLHAGLEVSVASTKAYVAEVAVLALLANAYSNRKEVIRDLEECCVAIIEIDQNLKDKVYQIAEELKHSKDIYFLGRGYDYDMSLEASLKLKEITYIHSEAVAGGELKHGPIALIDQDTPVIVTISDNVTATSMRANIQEVKARGAKVFTFVTEPLAVDTDTIVIKNHKRYLSPVVMSSLAFYFAYYVAVLNNRDVDKPRNLAKSVTVE